MWRPSRLVVAALGAVASATSNCNARDTDAVQTAWPSGSGEALCLLQSRPGRVSRVSSSGLIQESLGLDLHAWSGMDPPQVADEHKLSLLGFQHAGPRHTWKESSKNPASHMRILGHYNTGTHLLRELLVKNLDSSVAVPDPDFEGVLNGCKFWKHSSLTVLKVKSPATIKGCSDASLIGLAMIRNPLSWLRSFKHVAYDLWKCKDGDDWLTKPCSYPAGVPGLLGGKTYENVETIWSDWTRDYDALSSFGFQRSLVVRYEDLVLNTSAVLAQIADLAKTTIKPGEVLQVDKAANPMAEHQQDARSFAEEKIQQRAYLSEYTSEELEQICSRVDRASMRLHGYTDCDDLGL